jgi:hypothetical protein
MTTAENIKNKLSDFKVTSQKINMFNPNLGDSSKRVFKITDKDGIKFKVYAYTQRIEIEVKAAISLQFSVNLPDNICGAKKRLNHGFGYKIFTSHAQDSSILSCLNLIKDVLQNLQLKSNEGIFIYRNGVQLVVDKSRDIIPEISILRGLKKILESNFPESPEIFDPSNIPSDLQDLVPFLTEWAISDDDEREIKIRKSSKVKLKRIVDIVSPKMDIINNYLDSFDSDPMPFEATLIGNLAELVSELTLPK